MEQTVIEVGAGILDAKNVTDRVYKVYQINSGQFVSTKFELKDPKRIEEDKAEGGDGTFSILRFVLNTTQLYPDRGAGEDKELEFDLTRAQAEAVLEGRSPALHVGSPLGRLTNQCEKLGLSNPDTADIAGEVVVVAEYSREYNGRAQRRYDVVDHIGDRTNFDLERGIATIQAEMVGSKATTGGQRKAAY